MLTPVPRDIVLADRLEAAQGGDLSEAAPNIQPMPSLIAEDAVEHGEVFTRRWVVDLILDLAGYTVARDLAPLHVVEPACGAGAFIVPMVGRLAESLRRHGRPLSDAHGHLSAFDLLDHHVDTSRAAAVKVLIEAGIDEHEATVWAESSIRVGDYLLAEHPRPADVVVGNPPYIRLEEIPDELYAAYGKASPAMGGRADIYVGFVETALRSLAPEGRLVFICADRWMRNSYGRGLRRLFVDGPFAIDSVITMHDVDAFEEEVSAYPAITVMRYGEQGRAVIADTTEAFGPGDAARYFSFVSGEETSSEISGPALVGARVPDWFNYAESWPDGSPAMLAWLERLEETLPTLEEAGCRVGIGVATGADAVYVVDSDSLPDIEPDRLLPLAHAVDIKSGEFRWNGKHLVDPWAANDALVDINDYPRLAAYLSEHEKTRSRAVARKNPAAWWRTIDKVTHALTSQPKLLMEDMKARANPVLEPGGTYPHHNLYWVIAGNSGWDLEALGGLMLSDLVEAQVRAFCVKMRGGTLRFQAQYLRRVRLPRWDDVDGSTRDALVQAFRARDRDGATRGSLSAFGYERAPY